MISRHFVAGLALCGFVACGKDADRPETGDNAGSAGSSAAAGAGSAGRAAQAGSGGASVAGRAAEGGDPGTSGGDSGGSGSGGAGGENSAGTDTGGSAGTAGSTEGGSSGAGSTCTALPAAVGTLIEVTPEDAGDLPEIVRDAPEGATILLADGTYRMPGAEEIDRRIQVVTPGITLRSRSGNRDAVILDGEYVTEEMISVSASDVTLADITLMRAIHHPIHVIGGPNGDISGVRLHNLKILDGGQQFVKVNTGGGRPNTYADDGILECSHLELTDAGRPMVATEPGGCYTGGIDAHQARGWVVRENTFTGIHCTNGSLAEHAIHFWSASRDTLVERNTIIDCARGVGFGLGDGGGNDPERAYADDPYPGVGYVGHYDGLIRNNVIATSPDFEFFDTGIELEQARGARVLHNTVIHGSAAFASISHRFENTQVRLENNLVKSIRARDGSTASGTSNLEQAPDELFVAAASLDFHLAASAAAAIDAGIELDDAGDDIDGTPHDAGAPDLGADEYRAE
jgi:hypothetical protein